MLNKYRVVAGAGSRALLHYMDALHNACTARMARGLVNMDLTIAYVDEGAAQGLTSEQSAAHIASVAVAVSQYQPTFQFISVPLEDVYTLQSASATRTADNSHGGDRDLSGVSPADCRPDPANSCPPRAPSSSSDAARPGNDCARPQDSSLGDADRTALPAFDDGAHQVPEVSRTESSASAGINISSQGTAPAIERRLQLQRLLKVRLCTVPESTKPLWVLIAPSAFLYSRQQPSEILVMNRCGDAAQVRFHEPQSFAFPLRCQVR